MAAAADAAHKAGQEARKLREEEQVAKHAAEMSKRRKSHEKAFEFVWAAGSTGVSIVQMTAVKEEMTS